MKNEEILSKVDISRIIDKLGIVGVQSGKEFICKCPLPEHDDNNPSFYLVISGQLAGLWNCFSCGSKGNLVHLVQRILDLEREEAIEWFMREFGLDRIVYTPTTKELMEKLNRRETEDAEEDIVRIPLPRVDENQTALYDYLQKVRGYSQEDATTVIQTFQIQFVSDGYYRNRLILPIFDSTGQQVTFEACDITGTAEKRKLYPKGSPVGRLLFNQHNVESKHVWVVEGAWDAVRLWMFGEPAVSTFGAKLTSYQSRILINKFEDVMLMYDGDEAGRRAQEKARAVLSPFVNVIEVDLQFGDPDTLRYGEFKEIIRWLKR